MREQQEKRAEECGRGFNLVGGWGAAGWSGALLEVAGGHVKFEFRKQTAKRKPPQKR